MAYINAHRYEAPNVRALAAVSGIHIAIAIGLVAGLTVNFTPRSEERVIGINIPKIDPAPTIPPEPQKPEVMQDTAPVQTPLTPYRHSDYQDNNPIAVDPIHVSNIPDLGGFGSDKGIIITPIEVIQQKFQPVSARPKNDPTSWVTTEDYPPSAIRAEHEGMVEFTLSIDARGKVTNCAITISSGFNDLDQQTCKRVMQRAKFNPASDNLGAATLGTYSRKIRWQLPRN